MSKSLEELKRLAYENACCRCQYYIEKKCTNKGECVWKTIENELKALEIIKAFFKGRVSLHKSRYVKDEHGNYGYVHFISLDDKGIHIRYPISKEQYDLLNEVLK